MNKNLFFIGLIAAFIVGDFEGVARSNRVAKRTIQKLQHENEVAHLKVKALCTLVDDIFDGKAETAIKKFNEDKKFIDTIEEL